jgi:phosphoribosylformylglycinamidine (FGAM) synthase-like amidotransferase family enzyme
MGMMPHPERASESILSVDRNRNNISGNNNNNNNNSNDAVTIFKSLVSNLRQKAIA